MIKLERTYNAKRNVISGIVLRVYQLLIPFVMRTALLYLLGVEYLGLNSLFTSVLQVLNLAELGVGSAMIFSMYKPIAENDTELICALMNLYKKYYRIIGFVILVIGIILVPFIPKFINGGIPQDLNIYILYILNLFATVLSYWLFAYKNSILLAYQRVDISNKVLLFTETIKYILQLIMLLFFHNYYYYIIVILVTQLLSNVITAYIANKMYPQFKPKGNLTKTQRSIINQRIRDLFTSRIGMVIVNSSDTIVISTFLGLTVLATYQNYYYLITAIIGMISTIFNACMAGIGNSLIVESPKKNYKDFCKLSFIITWITGFCTICFLCLFQPFMTLWVGEKFLLDFPIVVLLCVYFYVYEINQLLNLYKDASGMWHEDRFRPLITALTNLILNIILIQFCGLYGVIFSTVFSMVFIGMPWLLYNIFSVLFERKYLWSYVKQIMYYLIVTICISFITFLFCSLINYSSINTIIFRLIICTLMSNFMFLIVYKNNNIFQESLELIDSITKQKFSRLISFFRINNK